MKHTKGKVTIDKHGSVITDNGDTLLVKGIRFPMGEHKEAEANAELIAECFNVTNECGLTPRQLLDGYNLLIGSLNLIIEKRNSLGWDKECSVILAEDTLNAINKANVGN